MTPLQIVADVSRRLTERGFRHLIGGSFASSAWGEIRATNDVDIAVIVGEDQGLELANVFRPPYSISLEAIRSALEEPGVYRMAHAIHMDEAFSIDLFLVRPDPYTLTEFERAKMIEAVEAHSIPFAAPENIVLQKLRWYEEGNRISDRQWNDIVRVLENQWEALDYAYLRRWAAHLGVEELLEQAFSETDPFV